MKKQIKAGVGVMVLKGDKVLLQKRFKSHGAGGYAFPGGHLEFGESIFQCAKREAMEEAGIKIKNIKFLFFWNMVKYSGKHYAHVGLVADWASGKPKNLEPKVGSEWGWYDLDDLPKPRFATLDRSVEAYKKKKIFFDSK